MKKIFIILFAAIALLAQEGKAAPAEAIFLASSSERIQLVVDGSLINSIPLREVYLKNRSGKHRVHIRVFDCWGRVKLVYTDKVILRPHRQNNFLLQLHPYKGQKLLRLKESPHEKKAKRHRSRRGNSETRWQTLNDEEYYQLLDLLRYHGDDQVKLKLAKKELEDKKLYAADIEELTKQFSFEQSRLHFAKWAYSHAKDPENYELVRATFRLEASRIQLDRYIRRLAPEHSSH